MTDKEKEVYMRYCKYDKEPKEVIMNLVSVIEKQQAEIEDLKKSVDYTYEAYQDAGKKMFKYSEELEQLKRDFKIVDHECSRLEQEDIRKDKIINRMASFISCYELDEDIVKTYCDGKLDNCKHPEEHTCKQCIKQYFERKIEQ